MVRNTGNKLTNGASLCDGGAPLFSFRRLLHLLCFFWLSTFDSITVVRPSVLWYQDENIWLTQKMMAALHNVSVVAISQHIKRIYDDGELVPETTVKKYLTVQTEGGIEKSRNLDHYILMPA